MSVYSQCCAPQARAPSHCWDLSDLVEIRVTQGQETEKFIMIRPLLCFHSSFFRKLLDPNGPFKENGAKIVDIQDDIKVFVAMQRWIHTGHINDVGVKTLPLALCKIWVFADKRGMPGLANDAIDALHEYTAYHGTIPTPTIPYILENTLPESKLYKFLHAQYSAIQSNKSLVNDIERALRPDVFDEATKSFLLMQLRTRIDFGGPATKEVEYKRPQEWVFEDRCRWHQHGPRGTFD
ncbi:hypothetical protein DM02DRAFT_670935 [Periconia macrospinosa]|uniref:BTB domain-containing protein n=1 Tax=Periconia macrospinosa TaxID=97972 RepID=A0A2V1DXC5_9PLEO|nr:hypothetical protein DM02DRAFT_670935 [Periconia macrospinosa]